MTPSFTLGPLWADQYVSGILLLNALLGRPAAAPVARPASPESIVETLKQIADGRYKAAEGAPGGLAGGAGARPLTLEPPALEPSRTYSVIVLNASTPASDFVSVETGGILFEDPAWAVLAAHAVSQAPRSAVPLAAGNTGLWQRLGEVQEAILSGKYTPGSFFGPISGFVPQPAKPEFRLLQVTAEQLTALRARGVQSIGNPPRFYELFQRPPVKR